MSETYEVDMFNGTSAFFDKETNLLVKKWIVFILKNTPKRY